MPVEVRHTEEKCIAALQRVAEKIGRTPMAGAKGGANGYPTHRLDDEPTSVIIQLRFGTWNAALQAAGLPLNRQPSPQAKAAGFGAQHFSDEDLLDAVRAVVAEHPYVTAQEFDRVRPEGSPSLASVRRRLRQSVGTYVDIIEAAGGTCGTRKGVSA
ncbi:MAG TPA: hypothetical protein VLC07_04690 [Solirubrobacterales bacterium]|nr:hypothetical protein [Solirubrobacterales bacterium]